MILQGFPLVSQLTNIRPTPDPKPNAQFDCIEASVGSAILWYQGKQQWDASLNPDLLKNAAYGADYTGSTSAARLVPICKQLGYTLSPVNCADYASAIRKTHELIRAGLPVIFIQQDDYSTNPAYLHSGTFFGETATSVTALDPYIAQALQKSDSQWIARLRSSQLWIVSPINSMELTMLQLSDPMGRFFVQKDANTWHCQTTNADLAYAHLDFFRRHEGVFGLPLTGEIYLESLHGTAIMIYERAIAIYDPKRIAGNEAPPGAGAVYLLHVDSGIGQQIIAKPLVVALNDQLAALKAELATKGDTAPLQARIAALTQQVNACTQALKQITDISGAFDRTVAA